MKKALETNSSCNSQQNRLCHKQDQKQRQMCIRDSCKDAQIIINTAGPSIQPGNSRDRMVLLQTNVQVMKEIMTQITDVYKRQSLYCVPTSKPSKVTVSMIVTSFPASSSLLPSLLVAVV